MSTIQTNNFSQRAEIKYAKYREILSKLGIKAARINGIVARAKATKKPLQEIVSDLGILSAEKAAMASALEAGWAYFSPSDAESMSVDFVEQIKSMPRRFVGHVPLGIQDDCLLIGIVDENAHTAAANAYAAEGRIQTYAYASNATLQKVFNRLFSRVEEELDKAIDVLTQEVNGNTALDDEDRGSAQQVINALIRYCCYQGNISDIHLYQTENIGMIKVRRDGVGQEFRYLELPVYERMLNLLIVNGGVKPEELKNEPKEAIVSFGDDYAEEMHDITSRFNFRLQLMQTPKRGRTAITRILDKDSAKKDLDDLGYEEGMVNKLKYYSELPDGLFIVTGPTGSGKSTTLFAMINQIDPIERSIQTMENPIEYSHGGWYQYEAGKGSGTSESEEFKKILKGMLRNDPDVLLVGEIRDADVAYIATQAANTGHLVFATLHANSSIKGVSRLSQMGADMSALSTVLRGILAQRLVRKLCSCKVEDMSDDHQNSVKEITGIHHQIYKACGCDKCGHTGYRGRVAIQELLEVNKEVRLMIEQGKTVTEIEAVAMPKEKTLWGAGIKLVAQGITSLDEIKRVASEDH